MLAVSENIKAAVHSPSHYLSSAGYEVADVLDAYGFGPHLWQAGAYIMRAGRKDDIVQDLSKACWYLRRSSIHPGMRFCTGPRVGRNMQPDAVLAAFSIADPARVSALNILLHLWTAASPDDDLMQMHAILEQDVARILSERASTSASADS
jgi:hypothetical protein